MRLRGEILRGYRERDLRGRATLRRDHHGNGAPDRDPVVRYDGRLVQQLRDDVDHVLRTERDPRLRSREDHWGRRLLQPLPLLGNGRGERRISERRNLLHGDDGRWQRGGNDLCWGVSWRRRVRWRKRVRLRGERRLGQRQRDFRDDRGVDGRGWEVSFGRGVRWRERVRLRDER